MNCFRKVLFVFFVAFVSSHKSIDATDYEIPDACEKYQTILLNGSTMNGSTFVYRNNRSLTVNFQFSPLKYNPNATVRFDNDTEETDLYHDPTKRVEKESMKFSLTGNWSDSDGGVVYYRSVGNHTDCNNRTATNLRVRATYNVTRVMNKTLTISSRDGCGVKVTPDGVVNGGGRCFTTLDFGNGKNISARWYKSTVTTENGPISFRIYSNCSDADVLVYYQENCRSMTTSSTNPAPQTTKSTDQPIVSTSQTTKTSEATVTKSPTTTESTASTTPRTTAYKSTVSTTPSSGLNVVAHALPITFALIPSMVQW